MAERLKRWESPRKRGRNDKGKGGSARARQLRKREQMLRQKLKAEGREIIPSFFCHPKSILEIISYRWSKI